MPEGLDDCVLELTDYEIFIQIKSRKEGTFRHAEVQKFFAQMDSKTASIGVGKKLRTAIALEKPCSGMNAEDIDRLFEDTSPKIIIYGTPGDEIVSLLSKQLDTAEVIAEGILSDLYRLVAEASEANASLPFEKRRRISTTEVERRISERLEAEDPSAIDGALASGIIEPVDFTTPVDEPDFYQGVKVGPGHVAAGLVLDRIDERKGVIRTLRLRRHVLVSGPSGAGKSALMWLSANTLAGELRWYQITGQAAAANADAVIRFVRARRPTETSPIGLVFDEVDSSNSDMWNLLVRELRGLPAVYFLGSVRKEDIYLITNQSDTEFVTVNLDETLAETVWEKLSAGRQTKWVHWREPFEQSEGLMLEYVHLLTQGKRLSAVIEEQVRQREREDRYDELAIIRSTSVLCAHGGEVEAGTLFELLGMKPDAAGRSLRRLIDEHLVRESRPGVLGGLHLLRSNALRKASHDEVVFLTAESLWRSLPAATSETLPSVIQSILADAQGEAQAQVLRKLAETLEANNDIEVWVSILTGLGPTTLERRVASFMAILEQHEVQRAQWSLASMFADPDIDIPDLTKFEQWQSLRNAVLAFRASPKYDLRAACLEQLPERRLVPPSGNLQQANKFFSCLAPICGGEPIRIILTPDVTSDGQEDIRQVAALLSTAYLIDPDIAANLVEALGGEEVLFTWFGSQTPWVTTPLVEPDGTHGRTVRSNWFFVAEQYQPDPHETVCDICETLIAISPDSDAAACDAVNSLGEPITVGDYRPWSKNMPRQNIPAKTRVAWNVAFWQILLARSGANNLTDYTRRMGELVRRTEKVFRSFTEKWIKGKSISNANALADEINEIIGAVSALAYVKPEKPSTTMTTPAQSNAVNDTLGALLMGILGNLVRRLNTIASKKGTKAIATFAGNLAAQAQGHQQSDIWRTTSSPPLNELAALSERLTDLACILHEMAYNDDQAAVQGIVKSARKGNPGKAIRKAARHCRSLADQHFRGRLRSLESTLKEQGWKARCWSRPIDESDSVYWPAREVAILVEIADFETDARYIEDGLAIGRQHLGNDWPFRIVPVMNGQVLASLALLPSSDMPLPDQDFAQKWSEHIGQPFLSSETVDRFDEAIATCMQLSAIVTCRDLENLHPEEEKVFSKAIESFERNSELVAEVVESTGSEYLVWALDCLDQNWNQVIREFKAVKDRQAITEPLCMTAYLALAGQENVQTAELADARIRILQAECSSTAGSSTNQTSGDL